MQKEDIIAAIKEYAGKLGGRAPSFPELRRAYPAMNMGVIRKYCGVYAKALREAGFEAAGCGYTVEMDDLFRDWARIVRKLGKIPSLTEYDLHSKYSVRPLVGRFRSWGQAPRGLHKYAEQQGLDIEYGDVLNVIRAHYKGSPEATWISEATEPKPRKAPVLPDRPLYGPPMGPAALACGPTNETGVVLMFGMLAERLGFVVTRVQTEFPDCEALRQVEEDRWQRVRIEFEYESRNFVRHMHDPEGCDLIVCWVHNWPECPVEVLELRGQQ